MPIANASMLDEATAAAEAMTLARRSVKSKSSTFMVAGDCHPQTIEVVQTRARPLGIEVVLANSPRTGSGEHDYFAVLAQYPSTSGRSTTCAPTCSRPTRSRRRSSSPPTCWR